MPTYPFLSEVWIAEARKIRAEFPLPAVDAAPVAVRMNQVITDVPFGSGTLDAHLDTSSGALEMETGHLEQADVTVTLDYDTAKAIFVDGTLDAGMKAFMEGRIRVQGDMAKLIAALQQLAPPGPSGPQSGVAGPSGPQSGVAGPSGPQSGVASPEAVNQAQAQVRIREITE